MRAYAAALTQATQAGPDRPEAGTWRWLCLQYFASAEYRGTAPRTQELRRRALEKTFDQPIAADSTKRFGDCPARLLTPKAIRVLRDKLMDRPGMANELLKAIRQAFLHAIATDLLTANPARDVPYFKTRSTGFYTWTVADVEKFEARHPPGSRARRALALLLYLGPRRGDVATFGRQMISDGVFIFRPAKTRETTKKVLHIPILPLLQAELDLAPTDRLIFIETEFGKPFTANGFGNWFKRRCIEAGLPQCSAHGLRKAGATIAAENGATPHQLMAVYGWASLKEAERYTREAQQKKLAREGIAFIKRG
jgi:integrase